MTPAPPKVQSTAPSRPRKGRRQPPQLFPAEMKRQQWLAQSSARDRERRRAHPLREMLLDLVVGLVGTSGVVVLALSYLHIIRW